MKEYEPIVKRVMEDVESEIARATAKHGPMRSCHEAYAVIAEELDEFWDLVKQRESDRPHMKEELIQVAAMAIRAIVDLELEND